MAKFIIEGQQPLSGEIEVYGAKNSAIKLIAASCMINGKTILHNVPNILDIQKIIEILEKLGGSFKRNGHLLQIDMTNLKPGDPDSELVGSIRASVTLIGPLLARFGHLRIPHPGGCSIGKRPLDLHIKAFRELGCSVQETDNMFEFSFDPKRSPNSNEISFAKISNGATENVLMFASLEEKETIINNIAIEPEIIDLISFLKSAGVRINLDNRSVKIFGNNTLKEVEHSVIPDRIEAGTFLIMAATTKNALKVTKIIPEHIQALLDKFSKMGITFEKGNDFVYIKKPDVIRATEISTAPFPDFPTDLQPPMGVLLTQAEGISKIKENLFDNRLGYLKELQKMGAKINILNPNEAEITGPSKLQNSDINSLDLRAGATLLIAGLTASGQTIIEEAENIDRGYEKIEERLKRVGAKIQRIYPEGNRGTL